MSARRMAVHPWDVHPGDALAHDLSTRACAGSVVERVEPYTGRGFDDESYTTLILRDVARPVIVSNRGPVWVTR